VLVRRGASNKAPINNKTGRRGNQEASTRRPDNRKVAMKNATAIVAITLATAAILVGGWFAYWQIAKAGQSARYDVNTHSQQYQAGLVAQERDLITGYDAATDPGQKAQIRSQFCAIYLQLNPATPDLSLAHDRIC